MLIWFCKICIITQISKTFRSSNELLFQYNFIYNNINLTRAIYSIIFTDELMLRMLLTLDILLLFIRLCYQFN